MSASLELILSFNNQLDQLAKEEDWIELNKLAKHRQQLLDAYFSISPLADDVNAIVQSIDIIKSHDQKRLGLINQKRQSVIAASLQLKNSKNAIKQYRANDRN